MTVLVTDRGFVQEDWADGFIPIAAVAGLPDPSLRLGVDVSSPVLIPADWARLRAALPRVSLIRIALRHFGDSPALGLARDLRAVGYNGRLRAHGAVSARFYTLIRRAGFTEIELDAMQARRQPSEHWRNELTWLPEIRRSVTPPDDSFH